MESRKQNNKSVGTSEKTLWSLRHNTIKIKMEIITRSKIRDSLILVFRFSFLTQRMCTKGCECILQVNVGFSILFFIFWEWDTPLYPISCKTIFHTLKLLHVFLVVH